MIPDATGPGARGSPGRPRVEYCIAPTGAAHLHRPLIPRGFFRTRRPGRHGTLRALLPFALRGGRSAHRCTRAHPGTPRRRELEPPPPGGPLGTGRAGGDASSTSSRPSRSAPSGSSREPPWPAARTRAPPTGWTRAPSRTGPSSAPAPTWRTSCTGAATSPRPSAPSTTRAPGCTSPPCPPCAPAAPSSSASRSTRSRRRGATFASSTSAAATAGSSPSSYPPSSRPGAGTRSRRSRCSTRRRA